RIDAAEHADEALLDAVAGGDLAGDVLLAVLGGVEVADLAAQAPGLLQGGLLQACGDLPAVGGEVLVGDAVGPEVVLQAAAVGEVTQGAAEEQAVEAAQDATDEGGEAG